MKCALCGEHNEKLDGDCRRCGFSLSFSLNTKGLKCPSCGERNENRMGYCRRCGQDLSAPQENLHLIKDEAKCRVCGESLRKFEEICLHCGSKRR
jgi:DNA-directed RNA polymerase subunit RPC12/RpoP